MKRELLITITAFIIILVVNVSAQAGTSITQVTTNSYEDNSPQIKGNYLVWQGRIAGDWEIFLYDVTTGEDPVQITDNDYGDISPQTDGNYVVWLGYSYSGGEIFLYDILSGGTTQITTDDNVDSPPQIANGRVAWLSHQVTDSVEPGNIFLYDVATGETTQLTNNAIDDISTPRIGDEGVVWLQPDPNNRRNNFIYFYDFCTGITSVVPGYIWDDPQSDGHLAVLSKHDGHDREIFVLNRRLGSEEQITDNDLEDRHPSISGNNIAWVANGEIFLEEFKCLALISPRNNAILSNEPPPTFTWEGIGYDKFKVQFSEDPDFPTSETLALPLEGWLSEASLTPTEEDWGAIRTIEQESGRAYWRVEAKGSDESVSYSETWSFTIDDGGHAATATTTGGGGDSGPCFIGTAAH